MKPSKEEIQKMIADLKELKPKVRKISIFGDNHHNAIDAQVKVLEEDLDEDTIEDLYSSNDHSRESAMVARDWLDGYELEFGILEDWESLVQK